MNRLEGKVAIITGAGSGFGMRSAKLFTKEGAKVVVADICEEDGLKTVEDIKKEGGDATFVKVDVANSKESANMCKVAYDSYGKIDILFNNAGIQGYVNHDIAHMDEEIFDRFIRVNLKGVWMGIRNAAPYMVANGGGSIINTASVAGMVGNLGCSAYGVSKGGVITLTWTAANEYARFGIRVNSISPYVSNTEGAMKIVKAGLVGGGKFDPNAKRDHGNPLNKSIDPWDIAYTALFLASDECSTMTGQNLVVDGGFMTRSQPLNPEAFHKNNPYPMLNDKI